ncbi:hypothetical protein [Corynebacterium aurimucosum]|uniref:hypothetical protein n=1 Tax=Corynebacterium aurimucosum TaxID=169292 RepID=UPI00066E9CB4|nr:hypothetical protein [Corynebacterium aurimucosum]
MGKRISFGQIDQTARWALRVADQATGADLVRPLLFDAKPDKVFHENVFAAGLCLSGDFSGVYKYTGYLSDRLVGGLQAELGIEVDAQRVRDNGQDYTKATSLEVVDGFTLNPETPGRDQTSLLLAPSGRFIGSLVGVKEKIIGSNAAFLMSELGGRVLVAAGLLFAPDFLAAEISLRVTTKEAEKLAPIVDSVGLGLHQSE